MKLFIDDVKVPFWIEIVAVVVLAVVLAVMFVSSI